MLDRGCGGLLVPLPWARIPPLPKLGGGRKSSPVSWFLGCLTSERLAASE